MTTSTMANPADLAVSVIHAAYSHLARVERLPAGTSRIAPEGVKDLPAILVRPTRDVPILGRTGDWASCRVSVLAFHRDGYLELSPDDLRGKAGQVDPGYLPADLDHVSLRLTRASADRAVRFIRTDSGVYLAAHRWSASVRLSRR
ncbi:hypothetical protein V1634_29125 [Plantactinospora veratri]|uniref:Uncharacterized protein n=1 Tax=Plantactinospora veratri TaxID=1436122 RepID=A0ABU7SLT8_9ACTN